MEEQKEPKGDPRELRQDALVEKLMPDPSQGHPDVRMLVGFLGRSSQPEYCRLYLTPELDAYMEIPRDAIVHNQSLANEQNPMDGTRLWVKQDTEVVLCRRTNLRQRQAQFLSGEIVSQADRRGMTSAEAMRNLVAYTWTLPPTWVTCFLCPTAFCGPVTLFLECVQTPLPGEV
ncbi:MAG: hypothetical protein NVSMB27_23000 [Ktedonobacteraceae bacterium]